MKQLTRNQVDELCRSAQLLKGTAETPGVFLTADNQIIKFIYKARALRRIRNNAAKLAKIDIPSLIIKSEFHYPAMSCYIIVYDAFSGDTIEDIIQTGNSQVLQKLAALLARLHKRGIYFADLNLHNIIQQENGELALIDIESIIILPGYLPLTLSKRALNCSRLIKKNLRSIRQLGLAKFLQTYVEANAFSRRQQLQFCRLLIKHLYHKYIKIMERNRDKLAKLDIPCIVPELQIGDLNSCQIDILFQRIEGTPIWELIQQGDTEVLAKLAKFVAYLHQHGVYNRCWSFGGIVLQQNRKLVFVDVRRMKIYKRPLGFRKRAKNLRQLIEQEKDAFRNFGIERFVEFYCAESKKMGIRKIKKLKALSGRC
ncbi:MAG: hypothetical protein KAT71_04835 [Gammaproteobacteria bacterium]|nr:hypothetical protein [Gammaproteobacteria bacterium]